MCHDEKWQEEIKADSWNVYNGKYRLHVSNKIMLLLYSQIVGSFMHFTQFVNNVNLSFIIDLITKYIIIKHYVA